MEREGMSEAAFTESFVQTEKYCPHQRLRENPGIAKASQVTCGAALGQGRDLGGDESPAWLVTEGAAYVRSGRWSEEHEDVRFRWGRAVNTKVLRPALPPSKNQIGSIGVDCVFLPPIRWDLQPQSLRLHQQSAFSWTNGHQ